MRRGTYGKEKVGWKTDSVFCFPSVRERIERKREGEGKGRGGGSRRREEEEA